MANQHKKITLFGKEEERLYKLERDYAWLYFGFIFFEATIAAILI